MGTTWAMIEISKAKNNTFQFHLKTADGKTLLESINFASRDAAEKTISQLKPISDSQHRIERRTNYNGNFLFDLKDQNGKTIGKSLLYDSEAGMENGISRLKKRIASL